jgi:hypothetical protein
LFVLRRPCRSIFHPHLRPKMSSILRYKSMQATVHAKLNEPAMSVHTVGRITY